MATTVHEAPKAAKRDEPQMSGGGGWRNLVPAGGDPRAIKAYAPPPASTAIWVVLASITMTFAAFTSAMIVRQGSLDWRHITLPWVLYVNTAVLIASSVSLEVARRRIAGFMGGLRDQAENPAGWLYVTLGLGILFVAGQYVAWRQLNGRGLYLATNPSSSFFYVFTAMHALHVLGGLAGLLYVIRRLKRSTLRRSTLDAASHYWHFMDILWVYLLLLLWMKL